MSNGTTEVGIEPKANIEAIVAQPAVPAGPCRILSLDGGGAKGFYTLGILKEIEGIVGVPLCERFQLIFGTSTGAIIAALLGLGHKVDAIHELYKKHVPSIMRRRTARGKTKALRACLKTQKSPINLHIWLYFFDHLPHQTGDAIHS